jgi:hypothetical protein
MGIDPINNISNKNKNTLFSYIILTLFIVGDALATSMIVVRKTGPRSNKIKQMQKQNIEDTQYKRDTDLRGSPSVGYVHQRNCQVLPLLLSSK